MIEERHVVNHHRDAAPPGQQRQRRGAVAEAQQRPSGRAARQVELLPPDAPARADRLHGDVAQIQRLHPFAPRHQKRDVGHQFAAVQHGVDAAHDLDRDALHTGGLLDEEAAVDEQLRPAPGGDGVHGRTVLHLVPQDTAKP